MDLLNYLHNDAAKKDQLREQVHKHEGIKARGYYDRLAILALNSYSYSTLNTVWSTFRIVKP